MDVVYHIDEEKDAEGNVFFLFHITQPCLITAHGKIREEAESNAQKLFDVYIHGIDRKKRSL